MNKVNKSGVEMLQILERKGPNAIVLCKCPICGNLFNMYRSHFYRGSNGCKCKLPFSERLYSIWTNIKTRCNNPNSSSSKYYYNKGINICNEWKNNYKSFEAWALEAGYNDTLTIDRIDNNLGYFPENCKWATYYDQANNKGNNVNITINGITHTLKQWSRILNMSYKTLTSFYYRHIKDETIKYITDKLSNKIKELEK